MVARALIQATQAEKRPEEAPKEAPAPTPAPEKKAPEKPPEAPKAPPAKEVLTKEKINEYAKTFRDMAYYDKGEELARMMPELPGLIRFVARRVLNRPEFKTSEDALTEAVRRLSEADTAKEIDEFIKYVRRKDVPIYGEELLNLIREAEKKKIEKLERRVVVTPVTPIRGTEVAKPKREVTPESIFPAIVDYLYSIAQLPELPPSYRSFMIGLIDAAREGDLESVDAMQDMLPEEREWGGTFPEWISVSRSIARMLRMYGVNIDSRRHTIVIQWPVLYNMVRRYVESVSRPVSMGEAAFPERPTAPVAPPPTPAPPKEEEAPPASAYERYYPIQIRRVGNTVRVGAGPIEWIIFLYKSIYIHYFP